MNSEERKSRRKVLSVRRFKIRRDGTRELVSVENKKLAMTP